MRQSFGIVVRIGLFVSLSAMAMNSGGCFSTSSHSGTDLSRLDDFKIVKGTTTESQFITEFGQPVSTTAQSDGTTTVMWIDGTGQGQWNYLIGSQNLSVKNRSLTATIRDGIVADYTVSDSQQQY
jgi:hypothetical protein